MTKDGQIKKNIRAALIILYDSKKRLLLQHRTKDAERLPDYWAFFGGEIAEQENPEDAVHREALEELNYRLKEPYLVLERDFKLPTAEGHLYMFVDYFNGDKSTLQLGEGQGWGWYKASEAKELKMIEHDRDIIGKVAHYLEGLE